MPLVVPAEELIDDAHRLRLVAPVPAPFLCLTDGQGD